MQSGAKRQALEANHGVAAPISEPVIPRDHGAQIGSACVCHHGFFGAAAGKNDELIGRHRQLFGEGISLALCRRQQRIRAFDLRLEHARRFERQRVPGLSGGYERRGPMCLQLDAKIAGAETAFQ